MIYIFGGAFDPPHVGHTAIVKSILAKKHPEKIIIIPSSARNDKNYAVSDDHRLVMLRIFVDEIDDERVMIDEYFTRNWEGEMITKDVDLYAREKYGKDIIHIFGTDTLESMPTWDGEGYAAKMIQKLFVPRWSNQNVYGLDSPHDNGELEGVVSDSNMLEKIMEGTWCRFSPWEGGVRGGYIEYKDALREYARENRKDMSEPEKDMWNILRGKKLQYKFHREKPIWEYIVDFYSPDLQLVIEIDGESHTENLSYDAKRTQYINSRGIHVLRYTNKEVMKNIEWVYEDIIIWIRKIEQTHPNPPLSGRGFQEIDNFELFTDCHIPDISSTELRKIIPEYTDLSHLFSADPKFIIPGLSKKISQYILEHRLYRLKLTQKPKILVHVCCGPDATMPILQLRDEYEVICFWYDPNIQPKEEHDKRYEAFVKVCEIENIPYIKWAYDVKNFFTRIKWLEFTPEKWEKCTNCYDMRMYVSAKIAARLKIPLYTSSLNTSPKKDLEKLFVMGHKYAEKYGITFLDIPFRKRWGFEKSVEYTREHDIFRQNYCGCIYSIRDGGKGKSVG